MIYLDHAATGAPIPSLVARWKETFGDVWGNPSSPHRHGQYTKELLETQRQRLAGLLGIASSDITFSPSTTLSCNIILRGIAESYHKYHGTYPHIVCSTIEHPAVFQTISFLETLGCQVTWVSPDQHGSISPAQLSAALSSSTALVCIIHVNNELGVQQDLTELSQVVRSCSPDAYFFSDTAQSFGKIAIPFAVIDGCTFSAHKLGGPVGIGGFIHNARFPLFPLFFGGAQEHALVPGTESLPLITQCVDVIDHWVSHQDSYGHHATTLRKHLIDTLEQEGISYLPTLSAETPQSPFIVSLSLPGVLSRDLRNHLSRKGICISTRSACSSSSPTPSPILQALHCPSEQLYSTIRISFGPLTTTEDLTEAVQEIGRFIRRS